MSEVIGATGLVKRFGRTTALDGLDLHDMRGQVHGFLGPNGAGKSTTIRILLGLLRRDGGEVALFGQDPWSRSAELHRRLAYVPGDVTLWPGLTGGEVLDLLGRIRGGDNAVRRRELLERFQLDPGKRCRSYSTGNRQKVALIAALCSDVELLIQDEPTSGLDPLMEEVFRDCVRQVARQGRTVLLSSHILSEVEALCDEVTIIRDGAVVEQGSLSQLRHLSRTSVRASLIGDPAGLVALPQVHDVRAAGPDLRFGVDTGRLDPVLAQLAAVGTSQVVIEPASLEELFLRHYDTSAREAASITGGSR